jgi:hypothetical protein
MLRGEWFLGLTAALVALALLRLLARRPLLAARARTIARGEAVLAGVSLLLLVFHCAAMFAPDVIALLRVLDRPAAVVRDLGDPVGQAAYWVPAAALVVAVRRLWWPAPLATGITLLAVGWTMYGDFTLTQHLVAIVTAGLVVGLAVTGLVSGVGRPSGRPRAAA